MVRSHTRSTDSAHKTVQLSEGTNLHLQIGDLTEWSGDAIVNAGSPEYYYVLYRQLLLAYVDLNALY